MKGTKFDKSAAKIKKTVSQYDGKAPKTEVKDGLLSGDAIKENLLLDMKQAVNQADALRSGSQTERAIDISLEQFAKEKFGFGTLDSFYDAVGINPSFHTMTNLSTMPDFEEGYRWLRPEVVREAIRLGLRRNPIYPDLIAAEETVTSPKITLPEVKMSDATPEKVGETETIPVGSVDFGEKDVKISKIGTGLKISDEVQKYVSLNILSLYLEDAGVKMGLGLDTMAVDTLINGDSGTPNYSAPVIGVADSANGITYKDMLRVWIRMGRLGRTPSALISAEEAAMDILTMDEFSKWSGKTRTSKQDLNIKTPVPQSQDYLIHGAMTGGNTVGFVDNSSALLKLNATGLQVESERIAERQLNGTYVTQTTGFAKLFRDSFVILKGDIDYSGNKFPDWMNVDAAENIVIK